MRFSSSILVDLLQDFQCQEITQSKPKLSGLHATDHASFTIYLSINFCFQSDNGKVLVENNSLSQREMVKLT